MTLSEFLAAAEHDPPREYVDGREVERPPLAERERWLRADLATLLYGWARATHQGAVAEAMRCTFGGRSYLPDVIYLARPPRFEDRSERYGLTIAPDLVCEICPAAVDPAWFATRLAQYVASGVRLAWLIDPADAAVTVYQPGRPPRAVDSGGMLDGEDVLPGFYLYLDDLFEVLQEEA